MVASPVKTLIILLILCGAGIHAIGREILQTVATPQAAGSAVGSQSYYPVEGSLYNPALLGYLERTGGFLAYGNGAGAGLATAHFFIPGSIGTLGISLDYLHSSPAPLDQYASVRLGYGRALTRTFAFGVYVRPFWGSAAAGGMGGLGVEPGLNYNPEIGANFGGGFGFFSPAWYLHARNVGVAAGAGAADRPGIGLFTGLQAGFWQGASGKSAWYGEVYGVDTFNRMSYNAGLSWQYNWLILRSGYMGQGGVFAEGVTLGAGADIPLGDGSLLVHYGVVLPNSQRNEPVHFISGGGTWGYIDKEAPQVSAESDLLHFSPNADGRSDYVNFSTKVSDRSPVKDWKLEIRNNEGRVVRTFESDKRDFRRRFGFRDFYNEFFSRRESLVVPRNLRWDGTSEPVPLNGAKPVKPDSALLPDGVYTWSLSVTDIKNNVSEPRSGTIRLDTTPPEGKLDPDKRLFSPNDDGALDTISVALDTRGDTADSWSLEIADDQGVIVRRTGFQTGELKSYTWDGRDNEGKPVPEGNYKFILNGVDLAGNRSRKQSPAVSLVRSLDVAALTAGGSGFSPRSGNGRMAFDVQLPNKKGLISWKISIYNRKTREGKPVRVFQGGAGDPVPLRIEWDGFDDAGSDSPDGQYYADVAAEYETGNHPVSALVSFIKDSVPPELTLLADLSLFSPDGDGKDEEQIFTLDIQDSSPLAGYNLQIWEVQFDAENKKTRIPFRSFRGNGPEFPEKLYWDGKADNGNLVESATLYEYELNAMDIYGNNAAAATGRFETDILVLVTDRGLKVRLSNIEFAFGRAELQKRSFPLLDKLTTILKRYPAYRIRVEGHTDDIGDELSNLALSEKRARAVMEYLISRGIDAGKLSFQGLGEALPVVPNDSNVNRARNRRVEFILEKQEAS